MIVAGSSVAQTFACQYVTKAGLDWEKGSWQSTRFKVDEPFFLSLNPSGQGLAFDSTAKILGGTHTCITDNAKVITCMGVERGYLTLGNFLVFDPTTMQGGRSNLLGSIGKTDAFKDSMFVMPFICQKIK